MNALKKYLLPLFLLFLLMACEDEADNNPYDDLEYPSEEIETVELDKQSLEGLHQDIFLPTCANSGCHDGNFEPDFRTIQSTYNTMVGHVALKGDPSGDITMRVVAGDADESMLIYRLTENLPNSSGIMPLSVEPDSDWNAKQSEHIDNIKAWINAGAKNSIEG